MTRVLVWGLTNNLAGTETVIANIVRGVRNEVAFDFLGFEKLPNYRDVVGNGNAFVVPSKRTSYLAYKREVRAFFRGRAPSYDAVWSNLNILNNVDVLRLGKEFGIPRRILHAHNAGNDGEPHQKALAALNYKTVDKYVTDRWSCSNQAGQYLFGNSHHFTVVPNAIDLDKYAFDFQARNAVRNDLGLNDKFVVGTVGRLAAQKNHAFLLEVFAVLKAMRPDSALVIVGDGALMGSLQERAERLGVMDSTLFLGARDNIPQLLSAFDAFAMPSLFEGLGISLLEAQAAGLPCVASDTVPSEVAISNAIHFMPTTNAFLWAEKLAATPVGRTQLDSRANRFDLARQRDFLLELFEGGL